MQNLEMSNYKAIIEFTHFSLFIRKSWATE